LESICSSIKDACVEEESMMENRKILYIYCKSGYRFWFCGFSARSKKSGNKVHRRRLKG